MAKKGYSQTGGCSNASRNSYAALQNSTQNKKFQKQAAKSKDKQQNAAFQQAGKKHHNKSNKQVALRKPFLLRVFKKLGLPTSLGFLRFFQLVVLIGTGGVIYFSCFRPDGRNVPSRETEQCSTHENNNTMATDTLSANTSAIEREESNGVLLSLLSSFVSIFWYLWQWWLFVVGQAVFVGITFAFVQLVEMLSEGLGVLKEFAELNVRLLSLRNKKPLDSEEVNEIHLRLLHGKYYKRYALAQNSRMRAMCEKISRHLKKHSVATTCGSQPYISSILQEAASDPLALIELLNPNLHVSRSVVEAAKNPRTSSTVRAAFEAALAIESGGSKKSKNCSSSVGTTKSVSIEDIFDPQNSTNDLFAPASELWNDRSSYQHWGRRGDDRTTTVDLLKNYTFSILFHGTRSTGAARSILANGFDPRRRSGQAYGPGEYFDTGLATAASFCNGGGLIIALVLHPKQGNYQSSTENDKGLKGELNTEFQLQPHQSHGPPKVSCFGNVRVLLNPPDNRKCTYALPLAAIGTSASKTKAIFA